MLEKCLGVAKNLVFEKSRITYYLNYLRYQKAINNIRKNKVKNNKIRVGFVCQLPDIWISEKPVYEAAVKDNQIEAVLIAVPNMRYAHYTKVIGIDYQEVYEYADKITKDYVKTYNPEQGTWIDPHSLNLDYIFIPRPYETYLPKKYRASALSNYIKVCYVPYAYMTSDLNDCCYNTHFVRNAYMIFCENDGTYKYVTNKLKGTIRRKLQKVYNVGYPRFDLVEDKDNQKKGIWKRERQKDIKRILWTPRWTPDSKLGGSNYKKYMNVVKDYMMSNQTNIDFVFRPHPMTFKAFAEVGLVPQEVSNEYCKELNESINSIYDDNKEYLDTFYESDILVTDDSSIIIDYLFTKNPIVYCPANEKFDEFMKERLECYYVVQNEEELLHTITDLRKGIDPKKEFREKCVKKMKPDYSISDRIIECIKKDYFEPKCF